MSSSSLSPKVLSSRVTLLSTEKVQVPLEYFNSSNALESISEINRKLTYDSETTTEIPEENTAESLTDSVSRSTLTSEVESVTPDSNCEHPSFTPDSTCPIFVRRSKSMSHVNPVQRDSKSNLRFISLSLKNSSRQSGELTRNSEFHEQESENNSRHRTPPVSPLKSSEKHYEEEKESSSARRKWQFLTPTRKTALLYQIVSGNGTVPAGQSTSPSKKSTYSPLPQVQTPPALESLRMLFEDQKTFDTVLSKQSALDLRFEPGTFPDPPTSSNGRSSLDDSDSICTPSPSSATNGRSMEFSVFDFRSPVKRFSADLDADVANEEESQSSVWKDVVFPESLRKSLLKRRMGELSQLQINVPSWGNSKKEFGQMVDGVQFENIRAELATSYSPTKGQSNSVYQLKKSNSQRSQSEDFGLPKKSTGNVKVIQLSPSLPRKEKSSKKSPTSTFFLNGLRIIKESGKPKEQKKFLGESTSGPLSNSAAKRNGLGSNSEVKLAGYSKGKENLKE